MLVLSVYAFAIEGSVFPIGPLSLVGEEPNSANDDPG